jgi:AAA15 family ATPase/GTPase
LRDKKPSVSLVSKWYSKGGALFEFAQGIICNCDQGIANFEIKKREDSKGDIIYYPLFHHKVKNNTYYLNMYNESSGTKSLFLDLPYYWYTIEQGSILVLDEFDINFHPHILPKLIELFTDKTINTRNAQLLFTTHNTGIIDVMSKYRTVFINKEDNESYGYRLDEISGDIIRNDRSIIPIYNAGKIGGVPRI